MLTGLSMMKKLKLSISLLILISLYHKQVLSLNYRFNWPFNGENVCLSFWNQCKMCISNMLLDYHYLLQTQVVYGVFSYASEIWCFHKGDADEKTHLEYLKILLKVRKNTLSLMIFNKLGRLPPFIQRKIYIVKFWCKLLDSEYCSIKRFTKMCLKKRTHVQV